MGIMRYDSEVSSDVIKCHQMSPLLLREHKKLLIKVNAERKSKVDDNTAKMQSIKWLGV